MANSTVWKCIIWFQIIHKNYNISHVFSQPSLSYFKNPLFIPFSVSLSLSLSIEFCTLNKTEGSWSYKIAPVFWNGKMEMNIRFGFNTFVFKLWVGQAWGLSELWTWKLDQDAFWRNQKLEVKIIDIWRNKFGHERWEAS